MNIHDFTQRIEEEAKRISNGFLFAYENSEKELRKSEDKVKQSINDYIIVSALLDKTNKDVNLKLAELAKEEKIVEEKINVVNKLINDFNEKEKRRIQLEEDIKAKELELSKRLSDISSSENELAKLTSLINNSKIRLEDVQKQVATEDLKLLELKDTISKLDKDSVKELKKAQEDKDKLVTEMEPLRVFLLNKQTALETKEKELDKKETGLKVVEERYKQLFGEKGLVFKV